MRRFYLLILLVFFSTGSAHAALLTFDNVPSGSLQNNFGNMPTYAGFNFSFTLDWIDVGSPGTIWPFGAHSGDFALINNNGGVGIVTKADSADFSFDGLWAKKWATPPNSGGVASLAGNIKGFNNGLEVWSINTLLNGSYTFIGGQAQKIDELHLDLGEYYLVDDINVDSPPIVNSVPIPAAAWLFGSCLISLFGIKKRSKLM